MESERAPLIEGEVGENKLGTTNYQEPPPSYDAVITEPLQPVVPTAPPLSAVDQQPYGLDAYQEPPQNAPNPTSTTTYTTVTTTRETRTRERYSYCPDFFVCYGCYFCYVPAPAPAGGCGNCDCDCLPPTNDCCGGNHDCKDCGKDCDCGGGDNPVGVVLILLLLALLLVALIAVIAYLIYRLGDDKSPAVARRYRIFAIVFGVVAYIIMISVGIAMAVVYA